MDLARVMLVGSYLSTLITTNAQPGTAVRLGRATPMVPTSSQTSHGGANQEPVHLDPRREHLAELERLSLLAEQAREQAHSLRSPLSVIELVSETLQLELGDDRGRAERLQRISDAVSALSTKLTQTVRSNRFADGPKRPVDAARVAAEVVRAFGGRLVDAGAQRSGNGRDGGAEAAEVWVDEQGLEAALVHLLRLIGVGYACNGRCPQQPRLHLEADRAAGRLRLHLSSAGEPEAPVPTERADYRLMARAAERVARDNGGVMVVREDRATFELPLAEA